MRSDALEAGFHVVTVADLTRQSRLMLVRVVKYLAGEAGIRQFLDIGTGLPTASNTHEVAQAAAPESRIVYVDNDPLVLVHARVLLTSTPEGACDYIESDLRKPEVILREAARTLDFTQPTAESAASPKPQNRHTERVRRPVGTASCPLWDPTGALDSARNWDSIC